MKKLSFLLITITSIFLATGCEKENTTKFYLNDIASNIYYQEEIIPADYQQIYGQWKLNKISGGFSGSGFEPDYDYLEIKKVGIYGLVRNDSLFEYGKIELDTFDTHTTDLLQIKLVPDYYKEQNPYPFQQGYIDLLSSDSLNLLSPCCDFFDYSYLRIK